MAEMADCIFCDIVGKKIPATVVFEDEDVIAFADTAPRAPVHLLVVPKTHVGSIDGVDSGQAERIGRIVLAAAAVGTRKTNGNFTLEINSGDRVEVGHFHVHVKGDRKGGDGA